MTSGEVTVETGKSQFIFYPPIFVYNLLISDFWSSLLLLPFLNAGPWAYSTIHGPRKLFVKARAGPGLSPTGLVAAPPSTSEWQPATRSGRVA
jgi:hypothetical protein